MAVIAGGAKTVSAAGTAEAISSTVSGVTSLIIRAKTANTGVIYVGDSTVSSSDNAGIEAGVSIDFPLHLSPVSLTNVYIDASVTGEGVDFWYTTVN